jgi:hypothetical protein
LEDAVAKKLSENDWSLVERLAGVHGPTSGARLLPEMRTDFRKAMHSALIVFEESEWFRQERKKRFAAWRLAMKQLRRGVQTLKGTLPGAGTICSDDFADRRFLDLHNATVALSVALDGIAPLLSQGHRPPLVPLKRFIRDIALGMKAARQAKPSHDDVVKIVSYLLGRVERAERSEGALREQVRTTLRVKTAPQKRLVMVSAEPSKPGITRRQNARRRSNRRPR